MRRDLGYSCTVLPTVLAASSPILARFWRHGFGGVLDQPNEKQEKLLQFTLARFWHGFGGELADFGEPGGAVRIEVSRLWWIV
jgi:hypothetical protein